MKILQLQPASYAQTLDVHLARYQSTTTKIIDMYFYDNKPFLQVQWKHGRLLHNTLLIWELLSPPK